jgi:hypothetical protein
MHEQIPAHHLELQYDAAIAAVPSLERDDLQLIHKGPPSWVFTDGENPSIAVRVTISADPERCLFDMQRTVEVTEELRQRGARVLEHLQEPVLSGGYVTTVTRYLAGKVACTAYGESIATLHNASKDMHFAGRIPSFAPMQRSEYTRDHLVRSYDGTQAYIGNTTFDPHFINTLSTAIEEGQELVTQMQKRAYAKGYHLVANQQDVHLGNGCGDQATLIDLDDLALGYAEFDLARVQGQWHSRFNMPISSVSEFTESYDCTAVRQRDPFMQELANRIGLLRYAVEPMWFELTIQESGHIPNEAIIQECQQRLLHVDDDIFAWRGADELKGRATNTPQS